MSDKAPDAFRTISEVAADLDLPQHVLRFWETKFSQIRPTKRSSGRRYYRPDDVALIRAIRDMLYGQGYTIRGVQRVLKERGARQVAAPATDTAPQPALAIAVQTAPPATRPVETVSGSDIAKHSDLADAIAGLQAELRACIGILRSARNG